MAHKTARNIDDSFDFMYDDDFDGRYAKKLGGIGWFAVSLLLAVAVLGTIIGGWWYEQHLGQIDAHAADASTQAR